MKVSMIIDLAGNLESRSRRYGQALMSMANPGQPGHEHAARQRGPHRRGNGSHDGRYAGAIAGMGVSYKAVRAVMDSGFSG